jgi:hypothetical protein
LPRLPRQWSVAGLRCQHCHRRDHRRHRQQDQQRHETLALVAVGNDAFVEVKSAIVRALDRAAGERLVEELLLLAVQVQSYGAGSA